MLRTVLTCMGNHKSAWKSVPLVADVYGELEGKAKRISRLTQSQEQPITGITADKANVGELLINQCLLVAGIIRGWAIREQDEIILAKVKHTASGLRRLADAKLPELAQSIQSIAAENTEALKRGGLRPAHLTELKSYIKAYQAVGNAPRNAIVARTVITDLVEEEISNATETLREVLDHLMHQFKDEHPSFYQTHVKARHIAKLPSRKRSEANAEGVDTETGAEESLSTIQESGRNTGTPALASAENDSGLSDETNQQGGLGNRVPAGGDLELAN